VAPPFHKLDRVAYGYSAYGLRITSDTRLPGLPELPGSSGYSDILVSLGAQPDWVREATRLPVHMEAPVAPPSDPDDLSLTLTSFGERDFFELSYSEGARFVLDSPAARLWGTWSHPLTVEDAMTFLLGPVMGFVLRRRGVVCLHASSACIGGKAIVLCGESETGKSTTVAALALAGFPVLAEDISPFRQDHGIFYVQPGYPRVCLWSDSVQALFASANALPSLTPTWEKRFLPLDGARASFESQRRPLGAIYLLAPRENSGAPRIEIVDKRDALLELIQNTYMNWLLHPSQRAAELDVLAKIVAQTPVRRIIPHADPARLKALCDLIINDATSLVSLEPAHASAAQSA
jgi:hypothetical protein